MPDTLKLLRLAVPCTAVMLLTGCGGGGGSSPSVTTYAAVTTAGNGGTVSPAAATVDAGGSATFTITPNAGYVISGVTGCGGALSGNSYTTGAVNANCTVTASFSAAFTWVAGSNTTGASGVYGTQGVAAAANVPGARDGNNTWMDASGNLWMFGGFAGYANAKNSMVGNFLNDLWEYSPSSGEWTWVGGPSTPNASGVYGTEGVAAPSNMPGARIAGARWTDGSGNVWLFGGATGPTSHMNDLWEYSPSSGEWTWMGGSNTLNASGVYGTQGVAAGQNIPGARSGALSWTDAKGNFWLFGGYGWDSTGATGLLNDLWEYSPSSGEWTWMSGSNVGNAAGVYGAQGVAAAANVPPSRDSAAAWTDGSGNLWLFGGEGYLVSTGYFHRFNDLWRYSPSSGQWTWVAGSNGFDATGVYGTLGAAAASNVPGARAAIATWQDASGNARMFGGYQYDDPTNTRFEMNDLWKYPAK